MSDLQSLQSALGRGFPFSSSQAKEALHTLEPSLSKKRALEKAVTLLISYADEGAVLRLSKMKWVFPLKGKTAEDYRNIVATPRSPTRKGVGKAGDRFITAQVEESERWQSQLPGSKNCVQVSLACLLGRKVSHVPNFVGEDGSLWFRAMRAWLENQSFHVMRLASTHSFPGYYLAKGRTDRDTSHMVVYRDGALHWDPHPERRGLTEVTEIFLVLPRDPARVVPFSVPEK